MGRIQGLKYKLLDRDMFPKFVMAYKTFYNDTEKKEPDETFIQNWLVFTMTNMVNPDCLYLLAVTGKKIIGFLVMVTMPSLDGIKSVLADPLYILPEYRGQSDAAFKLNDTGKSWAKQKGYKKIYTFENEDDKTWSRKTHLMGFKIYKKILLMEL